MAGSGRRTFTGGEVLTASNVMNYLQDQAVMNFAGTAARGSAIGSAVSQGMVSYLDDSNSLEVYKTVGTAVAGWEPVNLAQSPNVIINGAFDIWQRGTSFSASGYTADRWTGDFVTGAGTVSQQSFTPGTAPVAGYEGTFFLRRSVTTGAQFSSLIQRIEDVRTLSGRTVTLSFWAKGTNPTGGFTAAMIQNFGSGGSGDVSVGAGTLSVTGSWVRYSYTFNLPSMAGKTIGANSYVWLSIYQTAANTSASTLDLWGVQLEAGSTATPFRRNANSIQGELAACQRYYWRGGGDSINQMYGVGAGLSGTIAQVCVQNPVEMRVAPTSANFSNVSVTDTVTRFNVSAISIASPGRFASSLNLTTSGLTQYRPYIFNNAGITAGFFGLSAEL